MEAETTAFRSTTMDAHETSSEIRSFKRKRSVEGESCAAESQPSDDNGPFPCAPEERDAEGEESCDAETQPSDDNDPFPCALRCTSVPEGNQRILWWHSPAPHLPLEVEESMIETLVRWKKSERGMIKDQPPFRLRQIRKMCKSKGVPLSLALSLRRHHMKNYNPHLRMPKLRLGGEQDIKESARIFEECVGNFLTKQGIDFYTEAEQKEQIQKNRKEGEPYPPTPDFVLKEQVRIKKFAYNNRRKRTIDEQSISWLEVKMFYGASTIPKSNKSAVGCLLQTAEKYARTYGQGAMVFMHGCGDQLARELAQAGVMVLDCSSRDTVRLDAVHAHQRTWCADQHGHILP